MKKKKEVKAKKYNFNKDSFLGSSTLEILNINKKYPNLDEVAFSVDFLIWREGFRKEAISYARGYNEAKSIALRLMVVMALSFLVTSLFFGLVAKKYQNDIKDFESQNIKLEEPIQLYNVGVGSNIPCFK
jgi:hypothetical protein